MTERNIPGRSATIRIAGWGLLFLALTGLGIWWALSSSGLALRDLRLVLELPTTALFAVAALAASIFITDVVRYIVFARCVGERLSPGAALDASVANFFFSWLTPGAALGAPATIYVLGKRGVGWHNASVIAIGKSLTGIAVVIAAAALFIALGRGPDADASFWVVAVPGVAIVATLLLAFVLAGLRPARAKGLLGRIADWLKRRQRFSGPRASGFIEKARAGACAALDSLAELFASRVSNLVMITTTHVVYFSTLAALGTVLATSFGAASAVDAFAVTVVYIAFSYIAPTPGAAGIAEAFALPFYGAMLPPAEAVVVVILFRALTFYLHLLVGLPYLLLTVGRRGLQAAMSNSREPDAPTD